jgi:chromate transporter
MRMSTSTVTPEIAQSPVIDLLSLFLIFLKIGSVAFGGHIALVAVVERELVERRKLVPTQVVLDGVALASALPGPLAVNTVAYLGYYLRGSLGALLCITGVILPSFFLLIGLAILYQRYGQVEWIAAAFSGFMPAVVAIIATVAWKLGKQHLKKPLQFIITGVSAIIFLLIGGFWTGVILLMSSAILGVFWFRPSLAEEKVSADFKPTTEPPLPGHTIVPIIVLALFLFCLSCFLTWSQPFAEHDILRQLWVKFSGMSLAMFGGGYVFIPMMKEVVVDQLGWLGPKEFADAIALGQISPGPVMISATFIGYHVASWPGAVIATIAIFLPTAVLMTLCSNLTQRISRSPSVKAAYGGIRPCVIGMILTAVIVLGRSVDFNILSILIFLTVIVLTLRYKIDTVFLVPGAGLLALLHHWILSGL